MEFLLQLLMVLGALFLIVLVLLQRGRGGGLAGALGGMGGQSAFGAKAGDVFTRITIGVAAAWFVLCLLGVLYMQRPDGPARSLGTKAPDAVTKGNENSSGKPDAVKKTDGSANTSAPASTSPASTPPAEKPAATPK